MKNVIVYFVSQIFIYRERKLVNFYILVELYQFLNSLIVDNDTKNMVIEQELKS